VFYPLDTRMGTDKKIRVPYFCLENNTLKAHQNRRRTLPCLFLLDECHSSKVLIQFHFNSILTTLIGIIILIIRESIPSIVHISASLLSIDLNLKLYFK